MKPAPPRRAALALLFLAFVAASVLLMILFQENTGPGNRTASYEETDGGKAHNLADAGKAKFLSVFVYDANGGVTSLMVGGRTEEFSLIAGALEEASAAEGVEDETFADLLVFYFNENDTMEIAYSRRHNLLLANGRLYRPAIELAPVIAVVEAKMSN